MIDSASVVVAKTRRLLQAAAVEQQQMHAPRSPKSACDLEKTNQNHVTLIPHAQVSTLNRAKAPKRTKIGQYAERA
jgi:hypothetical protein